MTLLETFRAQACRIADLTQAQQALEWDQEVIMPPLGAEQRARQLSALAAIIHDCTADPAYGACIAALEEDGALDEADRADVREARRAHDRAVRIPVGLVAERTEACAIAQNVWVEARSRNDYAAFLPHLERVVALSREVSEALGAANPYDAWLDEFEPGMTETQVAAVFTDLRTRLVPLLDRVRGAARRPDLSVLGRPCPQEGQETFCRRIIADMGFDMQAGRLDVSAHPFTTGTFRDVRLTTRYQERFLPSAVFGAIHEAGHGLYDQGLDPARYRLPAGGPCSAGIHESQSRLWENLVARSRPFWAHYYPLLQGLFPASLGDVSLDTFHGAVNTVAPSLIRVEADQVTYNLHILLRFDLESGLLGGRIRARELPALWNQKMKDYLGIEPRDDRTGVLQDIHWAAGLFGYFPSYALGNLYAAQLMEAMRADLPGLDEALSRGELQPVKAWLNERIHRHGRRWPAPELCRRATGQPLSADPLLRHLGATCAMIYGA